MSGLSRRQLLLGGATLAGLAACAEPIPPVEDLERRRHATIGVFAVNLSSGRSVAHRAGEPFAMCSTFKVYAVARILQLAHHGELRLDHAVRVDPTAIVANSPRTQPRAGGDMTIDELCRAALQRSDNTAANLLLTIIGGPPAVTAFARSIGDQRSRLDRWETDLNAALPGDPRDTSTPEALGGGYRALLVGDALAPEHRQLLNNWMRANETSSMRAGLPPGWTTADKTGSGDYGSTNDIGIAFGPEGQRVLLAMMMRSQTDDPNAMSLRPLIGELTTLVLPALADPH
ncbi:class A beta-lactamase [Mycobacterium talmoniae]|uniref:Beta-lactamase n=1 Tax=Mycobacterium talmoniae TaxID=1858794 RepID=A0A1S1NGH5_9MYCO|nr:MULTISPECIES: class A beta-lactamase [Mycobacterium]OHV01772.1 class A beta-lactamase [Mycobacterium talmoniae]PQM47677.1 Beta-lactamase [Mycobacterium talmoniae]TDH56538.1 class A beta-lactamase [Mycobacterium eburneum]